MIELAEKRIASLKCLADGCQDVIIKKREELAWQEGTRDAYMAEVKELQEFLDTVCTPPK